MNNESIENAVKKIISEIAGYPIEEIYSEINIRDELLVDSIKQMEILAHIEQRFEIYMDESRLSCIETLDEFFELIHTGMEKKLAV